MIQATYRYRYMVLALLVLTTCVWGEVVIYPRTKGIEASAQYRVEVLQGAKTYTPFVHVTHAQTPHFNLSETTSFAAFAFSGKIRVRVTKLQGDFQNCTILPSSYGIKTKRKDNSITFTLNEPRKVAVEFDGDITHPLLIFADPPETDVPSPDDPDVLFFGPGYHKLADDTIRPQAGQTVYLAPGAYVSAFIRGHNTPNVTVKGRGILSGRRFGHTHGRHIIFTGRRSTDIRVEDIIVLDSPGFYVTTNGARTVVKNVKGVGWWFNTDGVACGPDGRIEDCFLKCNDDAVKLYHSGTQVARTTIWQMENGAPFQISWNMPSNNSGFVVKDCDIIHCDHHWDNTNTAVVAAIHGGSGHMSDYLFEDIRIENCDWRLLSLQIRPNMFARSKTLGKISQLTFRNIQWTTTDGLPPKRINLVQGYDADSKVTDIRFENLRINGQMIDSVEAGRFEVAEKTAGRVTFQVSENRGRKTEDRRRRTEDGEMSWTNPITNGLNSYGQKDFHIIKEGGMYYLTATEMPNPEWGKRGLILYASEDLLRWHEVTYLFNRQSIDEDTWYRDEWVAPEIHKIDGRFYLSFNCRNNKYRPYKKLGFGLAVADTITGPYKVLTPDKPLAWGSNATLFADRNGKVYGYWDLDGRIYAAELDLKRGALKTEAKEILGPSSMENYRFLDAPFVMRRGDTYYLLTTSFYTGYVIRARYVVSDTPMGPWKFIDDKPLMHFIESEADTVLKMPYSPGYTFAPPTQPIFNNMIFRGPGNQDFIAYHSSGKYAEPYLVLEPIQFDEQGRIHIQNHKQTQQSITLH